MRKLSADAKEFFRYLFYTFVLCAFVALFFILLSGCGDDPNPGSLVDDSYPTPGAIILPIKDNPGHHSYLGTADKACASAVCNDPTQGSRNISNPAEISIKSQR